MVANGGLNNYRLYDCHSRDSYQQNDTQTLQNEKPRQLVDYDAVQNRNVRLPVYPLYQLAELSIPPFGCYPNRYQRQQHWPCVASTPPIGIPNPQCKRILYEKATYCMIPTK